MYNRATKILLITLVLFLIPEVTQAGFLDDVAYCTANGSCGFADIAKAFSSLIRLLLGGFGAAALVYFVWGGIQWLISGGNLEKVARGRTIMINTIFAMILAFGSYLIVEFFINDFLNVKSDFGIEEGEFQSCFDAGRGLSCGEGRQCAGTLTLPHPHAELNQACLSVCQIDSLESLVLNECVDTVDTTAGWVEVIGIGLCPGDQKCATPPPAPPTP